MMQRVIANISAVAWLSGYGIRYGNVKLPLAGSAPARR
jgi:hypothetical protein